MIERHVTFDVFPEKAQEFESLFSGQYRPAMAKSPGFVRVELLRLKEDQQRYQMVIRFNSEEEAAAWRSSAAHQTLQPKLKHLYGNSHLQVFDVIA